MKKRFHSYEIGSQANCNNCSWRYEGRDETTRKAIQHAKKTSHEIYIEIIYRKIIPSNYY